MIALAEARELARLADPALTPGFSRDSFALQEAELAGTLGAQRDRETARADARTLADIAGDGAAYSQ